MSAFFWWLGKWVGLLLLAISVSSPAGFSFVRVLVIAVQWIDKLLGITETAMKPPSSTLLGLDYQTFWVIAGIIGIIWLTLLFSYWMRKLIQAIDRQTDHLVRSRIRGGG